MTKRNSMISVRQAHAGHAEAIWEIFQEVVREGTAFLSDDTVKREDVVDLWLSRAVGTYVACLNGEVGGAYMVKPNHPGRGAHVANATYMIKSAWRGQGIGRMLGEHSLKIAAELGFSAMQFNAVVSTNGTAVRLWESLGFVTIGTVPKGFQHPALGLVDVYIMHKFL